MKDESISSVLFFFYYYYFKPIRTDEAVRNLGGTWTFPIGLWRVLSLVVVVNCAQPSLFASFFYT